ncbi:MAG: lamin tail domain-containing protein [Gemmatimonadota bacterium]|nr:lamin tail domain-containing protein [Gemmatimonadota bacterium]MDE2870113.1 lamin tail domain-containing protein [Gemmatimonadota bacterium]
MVLAATLFASPIAATARPSSPAHVHPHHPSSRPDAVLRVTFFDVGQGDAVLLQAPEGQTALVDAGRGSDIVPLLRDLGVERIDLMVATHPHADHIGGMAGVIESIPVRFFMDNGAPHTTATYRGLIAALQARPEITYLEATPRTISLGSATIEVLPLLPRGGAEHNDRSITLVLRFGDFTALLSGDSEVRQLTHLTGLGVVPALTLLKAPHHGSDNGFTWDFLQAARPRVVVISVGRNNSYGHPRQAALDAYAATARETFRTDLHGHLQVRGYGDGSYVVVQGDQVASVRTGGWRRGMEAVATGAATAGSAARAHTSHAQLRIRVRADAPGNDHQNPNGEYAVLENSAAEAISIGGWRLCDLANHCFQFPAGATIEGGGRVVVHTGSGQPDGGRFYMGRRQAVWNNDGDTATLYDSKGATVLAFSY